MGRRAGQAQNQRKKGSARSSSGISLQRIGEAEVAAVECPFVKQGEEDCLAVFMLAARHVEDNLRQHAQSK